MKLQRSKRQQEHDDRERLVREALCLVRRGRSVAEVAQTTGLHRLTVERGGTINGQTVSSRQMLTLSPDRSELTVERLVIVQHGYTLKGTPNYASVKDVFVCSQ